MTAKNILELSGKDLEKEIDRIATENPARNRPWTQKEEEILMKLRGRGVPFRTISKVLGRSHESVKCHSVRR